MHLTAASQTIGCALWIFLFLLSLNLSPANLDPPDERERLRGKRKRRNRRNDVRSGIISSHRVVGRLDEKGHVTRRISMIALLGIDSVQPIFTSYGSALRGGVA
jgi:hypothetical protein